MTSLVLNVNTCLGVDRPQPLRDIATLIWQDDYSIWTQVKTITDLYSLPHDLMLPPRQH
jgi:hypothetical protein